MRILGICLLLCAMAVYIFLNFESILNAYFPRFAGKESSVTISNALRLQMFQNYVYECRHNLKTLLLGIDPNRISSLSGNLHNSYFQVHSTIGMIWLVWIIVATMRFARKEIKKKNLELLIPVFGFMIRAFMDWCFPGFLGGIIIWFVVFSSLNSNTKIKRTRVSGGY